jgi:DNA modification methylase
MENKILKTELVNWKALKLFQPGNIKKMSPVQLKKLKTSLEANGLNTPFYVWQDQDVLWCLDGHMRIPVLKLMEGEGKRIPDKLPANFVQCKNRQEAKKVVLIFNSHYANILQDNLFEWIKDLNLDEIRSQIDIASINFDIFGDDVQDIDAEPQFDIAEELQKKYDTRTGQVWILGEHRIICGDASNPDVFTQLLDDDKPSLVFTDPPYGVSIGEKNRLLNTFQKSGRNTKDIESDDKSPSQLKEILTPIFKNIKDYAADDCTFFVTAPQGGELGMMMMQMVSESLYKPRHILIWKKNAATFSMGRLDYDYQHEPILLTWGKKHKSIMAGKHRTSVWEIDRPQKSKEHPTMKPVELYDNAILNNSEQGDVCLDAFSGSGTMIISCERTGRKARVIEIDPGYVAVAIQRWVDITGREPELWHKGE